MGRAGAAVALLVLSVAGCGSGSGNGDNAPPSSNTASPTATTSRADLVGAWRRTTTCEERVAALDKAGLGRFAVEHAAGEGWLPGISRPDQISDPDHPCAGAVPREHQHFFTADGRFGSRDADGQQVDDGTYRLAGPGTVVIDKEFGEVTFHYRVAGDGTLTLDPVMPDCAASGCFAAQWAVAVACPGLSWQRAPGG